jgi:hypothetical protein
MTNLKGSFLAIDEEEDFLRKGFIERIPIMTKKKNGKSQYIYGPC